MRRLTDYWYDYKEPITLLASVLASLILIFSNDNFAVHSLRLTLLESVGSVQSNLTWFTDIPGLREENHRLHEENVRLSLEADAFREAYLENERLREMLGFVSRSNLEVVPAAIIGEPSNGVVKSIILNVGASRNVEKGMPLITAEGLVGRVQEVGPTTSIGHVLLDRNFRVSIRVDRSRVLGILRWHSGNLLVVDGVPKRADVRVGDTLVTSGFSSTYPPGLKVGVVRSIAPQVLGMFTRVLAEPTVDFTRLDEVFVLKGATTEKEQN